MTQPFLCTCQDGFAYIVKGRPKLRQRELVAEYVSAYLAKKIGLTCPDFCIVEVGQEIIEFMPDLRGELSPGPAFATRFVENASTINIQQARNAVNLQDQKKIYFFDRWIKNADRSLTVIGGNVNIIFDTVNNRHFLIDHNLAFAHDTTNDEYDVHVYSPKCRDWVYDIIDEPELMDLANDAIDTLGEAFNQIPDEWFLSDEERERLQSEIMACLSRVRSKEFWSNIT
ncbi:HipA family kinase [unidentified bacterial endosymbiont]|uniref:HipA family kinase n=1 Tax=unidentified bacterial endosymbiont TaxID=2355 RepID=UPI00345096F5